MTRYIACHSLFPSLRDSSVHFSPKVSTRDVVAVTRCRLLTNRVNPSPAFSFVKGKRMRFHLKRETICVPTRRNVTHSSTRRDRKQVENVTHKRILLGERKTRIWRNPILTRIGVASTEICAHCRSRKRRSTFSRLASSRTSNNSFYAALRSIAERVYRGLSAPA